jgi:DNA-binding MarR family transcriptional regulator
MGHEPGTIERLDRALLSARRALTLPEISALPLPELDRTIDPAKALACMAIADLVHDQPNRTVTVKDVAAALTLEHSTASRLLADTEALGLLSRASDPQDRRRTSVSLTPTGQHVVEEIVAIRNWALSEVLAQWPDEDVRRFSELIEEFTEALRVNLDQVIVAAAERFSVGTGPGARTPQGSSSAVR